MHTSAKNDLSSSNNPRDSQRDIQRCTRHAYKPVVKDPPEAPPEDQPQHGAYLLTHQNRGKNLHHRPLTMTRNNIRTTGGWPRGPSLKRQGVKNRNPRDLRKDRG
ncbi:hypothetical protein Nepgr_019482 [Nepenthes gracilis]|uniref:Uncharacterized protein n=1 Tax=Nepenthes gracilis TaxID=150966 RepID=A0AAD3XVD8_NEPGR|nr:hypothetical protein Nepgr_019482 [Nepenthes gracilis]